LSGKVRNAEAARTIRDFGAAGDDGAKGHYEDPAYYAKTYKELVETTDWDAYGRGRDPRCDNCMAHCGYEPTAVLATTRSLKESVRAVVGR